MDHAPTPSDRVQTGPSPGPVSVELAAFPLLPVLAILGITWAAVAWPWLSGSVVVPWDAKAHFYPQLQFLADSLHRGDWPFWNPYVFGGHPQIADPQSLIFSPPFFLLALLDPAPSFAAADGVLLGTLLVGAAFVVLIGRDLGWHPAATILAALVFAFGGSSAWRIQHVGQILSLAYLPVAFWLLDRTLMRRSIGYGIAAGLVAGFMVLGRDQVAYLGVWLLTGRVVWRWMTSAQPVMALRGSLLPLAAGACAGLMVAGPPTILTLLLQAESNRVAIDLEGAHKGSLHPASMLTLVVPRLFGTAGPLEEFWGPPSPSWGPVDLYLARNMSNLYVGALALLALAAAGWRRSLWRDREAVFWSAALVVAALYMLGRYTPVFQAFFAVPGVSLYRRPADATFLFGPALGMVAGFALNHWLSTPARLTTPRARHVMWGAAPFAGLGAAAALVADAKDRLDYAALPLAEAALAMTLMAGFLIALRRFDRDKPLWAAVLVAVAVGLDLGRANGPNESTALPSATYDSLRATTSEPVIAFLTERRRLAEAGGERDRVELSGIDFHWPNASMVHKLDNVLGYNPVRLAWYSAATGAGDHVALPDQRRFSALMPGYASLLSAMLGLRYVVTRGDIAAIDPALQGAWSRVLQTGHASVYENPRVLPRVMFVPNAQEHDPDALIRSGVWPPGFDPRNTVLVAGPAQFPPGGRGRIRLEAYRNGDVSVAASSERGGYVVLNDTWHPWWRAELDGQPVPLLRANAIMRAVLVPPGDHRVRFVFRPFRGAWEELLSRGASATINASRS